MTPPMSAQEKELALGATFYKEFARSVDNASRLIFPSSFSFKTNLFDRNFFLEVRLGRFDTTISVQP